MSPLGSGPICASRTRGCSLRASVAGTHRHCPRSVGSLRGALRRPSSRAALSVRGRVCTPLRGARSGARLAQDLY